MARAIATACLLAVLAGLAGCGTKKVSISGTITHNGQKLTWPDGGHLIVIFCPENPEQNDKRYPAQTDLDTSTYKIGAIPPGKYTVAVQQFDVNFNDSFGKAHDLARTKLTAEVTHDGQVIDVDVPATDHGGSGFGGKGGFAGRRGKKGGEPPAEPEKAKEEPGKVEVAPPPREKKTDPPAQDEKKADPPKTDGKKD
jgi:hypothetical protein